MLHICDCAIWIVFIFTAHEINSWLINIIPEDSSVDNNEDCFELHVFRFERQQQENLKWFNHTAHLMLPCYNITFNQAGFELSCKTSLPDKWPSQLIHLSFESYFMFKRMRYFRVQIVQLTTELTAVSCINGIVINCKT